MGGRPSNVCYTNRVQRDVGCGEVDSWESIRFRIPRAKLGTTTDDQRPMPRAAFALKPLGFLAPLDEEMWSSHDLPRIGGSRMPRRVVPRGRISSLVLAAFRSQFCPDRGGQPGIEVLAVSWRQLVSKREIGAHTSDLPRPSRRLTSMCRYFDETATNRQLSSLQTTSNPLQSKAQGFGLIGAKHSEIPLRLICGLSSLRAYSD